MSRPKSKEELLYKSNENYLKLTDFVDRLSPDIQEKEFPKGTLNRNIRDVLAHLHHWHLMFLDWYTIGMTGVKPAMPAEGYSWKDTPRLNKWIQQQYQDDSLKETKNKLTESFEKIQNIIEGHTNEELFEKKRFKWTGTTSMGAYLVSATSSHYDWAFKLIEKSM